MPATEETIRSDIRALMETAPRIHMDVSISRPKLQLTDAEATIIGVYPHFFIIEESSTGRVRRHSLGYADVLIRRIIIRELEQGRE